MRKTFSTRLAVLIGAGGLMVGCGDNLYPGGMTGDDEPTPIDGPPIDMTEETTVYTGTITVLEVSVHGVAQLGQGIQVAASFAENGGVAPVFEEQPGSPLGCKVWEYTPAQAAELGLDEGVVSVTIDNPEAHGFDPEIPACAFVAGRGYICPDTMSTGPVTVSRVPDTGNPGTCFAGRLAITDADAPFTFAVTDGRYMTFTASGALIFPDGAAFPVIGKAADTTVVIAHPAITDTTCNVPGSEPAGPLTLPDAAVHTTLGGAGPIPGVADPGLMADDADVDVTLTMGGDGDIPTFTAAFDGGIGDDFALAPASQLIFTPYGAAKGAGIPLDGTAFTVSCEGQTGCGAGTGAGVVLSITTTDGEVTGTTSHTTMPTPETKEVSIRCAGLATTSVTVSETVSAYLESSGATKLQATLIRGDLDGYTDDTTSVNVVAGHAITTFMAVPPPTAN